MRLPEDANIGCSVISTSHSTCSRARSILMTQMTRHLSTRFRCPFLPTHMHVSRISNDCTLALDALEKTGFSLLLGTSAAFPINCGNMMMMVVACPLRWQHPNLLLNILVGQPQQGAFCAMIRCSQTTFWFRPAVNFIACLPLAWIVQLATGQCFLQDLALCVTLSFRRDQRLRSQGGHRDPFNNVQCYNVIRDEWRGSSYSSCVLRKACKDIIVFSTCSIAKEACHID